MEESLPLCWCEILPWCNSLMTGGRQLGRLEKPGGHDVDVDVDVHGRLHVRNLLSIPASSIVGLQDGGTARGWRSIPAPKLRGEGTPPWLIPTWSETTNQPLRKPRKKTGLLLQFSSASIDFWSSSIQAACQDGAAIPPIVSVTHTARREPVGLTENHENHAKKGNLPRNQRKMKLNSNWESFILKERLF